MSGRYSLSVAFFLFLVFTRVDSNCVMAASDEEEFSSFRNLLNTYCSDCHTGATAEADVELNLLDSPSALRLRTELAKRTLDTLQQNQMPPVDSPQPSEGERQKILLFLDRILKEEAERFSGDPGPIVLRRLNNAEYTNSIRDLTGVESLDPAKEFPVDGAAGEGFTNAGNALSMSPAMLTKYLDAGRDLSQHAVLLPDGFRFSSSISRRDWTEEVLGEIRSLYAKYSAKTGATQVNLQGVIFDTNDGGRLPFSLYLQALIEERKNLEQGSKTISEIAIERQLSPKYLQLIDRALHDPKGQLMASIARQLKSADPNALTNTIRSIEDWQKALWKFSSVGHIGKKNGPARWMEPVNPISTGQEFRLPLPTPVADAQVLEDREVVFYLSTTNAGDGSTEDASVWERPRFVLPGRPDLLLRDCDVVVPYLREANANVLRQAKSALAAADWATRQSSPVAIVDLARRFECDEDVLRAWFDYLGIQSTNAQKIKGHVTSSLQRVSGYEFVSGWSGADALSVIANSSSEHVRIPGNLAPHSLLVHPAPTMQIVVGWESPINGMVTVKGSVQHAHPECGNGVQWSLQLRRNSTIQNLASGIAHGPNILPFEVSKPLLMSERDIICLVVSPRDGNHSCDATAVQLTLQERLQPVDGNATKEARQWDLSTDVAPNILQGNPHQDSLGNSAVWHFFGEPVTGTETSTIPAGSLLAQWQASSQSQERMEFSNQLSNMLSSVAKDKQSFAQLNPADRLLIQQLTSLAGPLMNHHLRKALADTSKLFDGPVASENMSVAVPGKPIEVRVPASLVAGSEFIVLGRLADPERSVGSVQMDVTSHLPQDTDGLLLGEWKETNTKGTWTDGANQVVSSRPIVVSKMAKTRQTIEAAFDEFRQLFPAALCYNKIVPVDEVVTLTLYYREDDALSRLMLSDRDISELDRLWDELHYISRDALSLVDAFDQLWQYATQDADPSAFEPLRKPIMDRAVAFRETLLQSEPKHLEAIYQFASKAFRRPLSDSEKSKLLSAYKTLRDSELDHETAIRSLLTKIFISPAFLYKSESGKGDIKKIGDGKIAIRALTDFELATRLSYMITGTLPDDELLRLAAKGALSDPEILKAQARRLLQSAGVKSIATEFGCQWLHVYQFDTHDEKSDASFPDFASLRSSMYQESILFWVDMFRNDASLLNLLSADYAFVDSKLAQHYGVDWESAVAVDVPGFADWRRIPHATTFDRGGILTMASVLSKQSGASRTSPILRGNWISEVLLGEKLPRPPKNVPVLPETAPEGLTERQLIEMHSSDPACAKCHARIDPFGFAWEGFDAIGRRRDPAQYDTSTSLPDGTKIEGWIGLREYLMEQRKEEFTKQFCKKLLGYSLGRAVQLSDQTLIAEMEQGLKENDYRVSAALNKILESQQFRFVRTDDPSQETGVTHE
ncbi:MAG: DUF1592 domain-containing protein [Pirellula sp.]|jgi:hypothetical protein